LEFVYRLEEFLASVAGSGDFFFELSVGFVAAVDLHLEVFDRAVDVADVSLGFVALGFLGLELGFEL
jgi:hypothetical protein